MSQADVGDHMDFAITSIDMFAGVAENLINYAFNVSCDLVTDQIRDENLYPDCFL